MYVYIFCEYPAVIKFQGVIFGTVDNSVKFCNLDKPYPMTEICPLFGGENFNFYLNDEFLASPPKNVTVTDLKGGYFLRFSKKNDGAEFKILEQAKFQDATITAFTENGYKISLDTQSGFFAETLDFSPNAVQFYRDDGKNTGLIFALFNCKDKKILNVYKTHDPALIFSKQVDDFNADMQGFTIQENLKDLAKHSILINYAFDGSTIKETSRKVSRNEKFDREKLPDKLIPYAFTEEFLCGGDYAFYLSDGIKENADKLQSYFGDFLGVMPPPVFRQYDEIGLIYRISERKYSVEYFTFDVENGKITNIKKDG